MNSSEKLDPNKLKRFVRHLCLISKKHKDREEARSDLYHQINSLKRFSSRKKEMDEELKELNKKVSLVLEKESKLFGIKKGESFVSEELIKRTLRNKEMMQHIQHSIDSLKEKLEDYMDLKTERQRKIDELEDKIRSKIKPKRDVSSLKAQLNRLEERYLKLKSKGVDLGKVKDRIEDLKLRLLQIIAD